MLNNTEKVLAVAKHVLINKGLTFKQAVGELGLFESYVDFIVAMGEAGYASEVLLADRAIVLLTDEEFALSEVQGDRLVSSLLRNNCHEILGGTYDSRDLKSVSEAMLNMSKRKEIDHKIKLTSSGGGLDALSEILKGVINNG